MSKLSVYIIAYNSEKKIKSCIESILWADEIILVDSYSTDKTKNIVKAISQAFNLNNIKIFDVEFNGFGNLRNKAISFCSNDWILSIDSDEICTIAAQKEILEIINFQEFQNAQDSKNFKTAYFIPRKNIFMGKEIKYSGYYPDYRQPQLFRKNFMNYTQDLVHESFVLKIKNSHGFLKNSIYQVPFLDLEELLCKINRYSNLGADRILKQNKKSSFVKALGHGIGGFIQQYFLKLGILDGFAGFILAFSNFEAIFYKYLKALNLNKPN